MSAIFVKEFKSYFKSLVGWLYLSAFILLIGIFFFANNIFMGSPYAADSLGNMWVVIIVMILTPLLTMRVISEEKRQKTDQFLITAPISLWKVIIGKFLALCAIEFIGMLILILAIVLMRFYGDVPIWENVFTFLAFFLFSTECIAIGMFTSSITEHQFPAALMSFGALFVCTLIPIFVNAYSANRKLINIVNAFNICKPYQSMLNGIIDLRDIFYMLSVIAIFLLLSYKIFARNSVQLNAVGKERFFMDKISVFLVIAFLIAANILAQKISTRYMQFDFSQKRFYTISSETKEYLKSMDRDVTIYVLSPESQSDQVVERYMNQYQSASKHIDVKHVDMTTNPTFALQFTDQTLSGGSIIAVANDTGKSACVDYYDLYEVGYYYDASSGGYQSQVNGIDIDGQTLAAVKAALYGGIEAKIYCLTGHNELDLLDTIVFKMRKSGYVFEQLSLIKSKTVPEDCSILLINGPMIDLTKEEVDAVEDYLENGGTAIMMASGDVYKCVNYDALINSMGVNMTPGTVLETDSSNLIDRSYPFVILLNMLGTSVTSADKSKQCVFYTARGFELMDTSGSATKNIEPIFVTSSSAYTKVLSEGVNPLQEEGDETGAFALAELVSNYHSETDKISKVVLFGSSDFLESQNDSYVAQANSNAFMHIVTSLVSPALVTDVPAKPYTYTIITVSAGVRTFYVAIWILSSIALIIAGVTTVILRSRN